MNECIHEDQIQTHSQKLKELEVRIEYKHEKIEEMNHKIEKMDKKLDNIAENVNQLMLQSIKDDNTLDQRLTTIETRQDTLYRLIGAVAIALTLLDFILKYIIK